MAAKKKATKKLYELRLRVLSRYYGFRQHASDPTRVVCKQCSQEYDWQSGGFIRRHREKHEQEAKET